MRLEEAIAIYVPRSVDPRNWANQRIMERPLWCFVGRSPALALELERPIRIG